MPKGVCVLDEDHWINTARNNKNVTVTWQRRRETQIIFEVENNIQGGNSFSDLFNTWGEREAINSTYAIVPGWKSGWHSLCDRWGTKVWEKGKKAN